MRTTSRRRKLSAQPDSGARRPSLRLIALTCAGLTLIGGAYQAAFARGPVASTHGYPHPDRGDDDGDGFIGNLSTGESIAVIAVPIGILGAGIYLESQDDDDDDDNQGNRPATFALGTTPDVADRSPALPEGDRVSKVRLAGTEKVEAGYGVRFQLEGRSARDGKWYSLSGHPATRVEVKGENSPLLKVDGAPAAFGLPITAPASLNGQQVAVTGTFAPEGASALSADTKVRLVVPGSSAASN